jgi:alpha-galactosidase
VTERWLYLRGGDATLLIDTQPGGEALPRVVHFGGDLGAAPDFEMISRAAPRVLWGGRLDVPCPPCVLPGLESGYFGCAAVSTSVQQRWVFVDAVGSTLHFKAAGATIEIDYQMSRHGVLAMRVRSKSGGPVSSLALPLPSWAHEVLSFGGDWAREFAPQRHVLQSGLLAFESLRGRPGHDRFPGLFVGATGFGDSHGAVYGFALGWSGSHRLSVERLREGDVVVQAGELHVDDDGAGASYESPWAFATFSPHGLNGVMQAQHAFLRERIVPARAAAKPRPVHYNTWEAIYFDHDEATLRTLADRAAAVGAERFVLDDGWFKGRANDSAGLGDWAVDALKFPNGLAPLIAHVRGLGMEFGLWVEPEMVNPDSDLARAHPDWIRREGDHLLLQRHQAVLDLGNADVCAHLYQALDALLGAHEISYLKWDMNRDLTGAGHGSYVRALYELIDRLRAAHPDVEIEACASGGGRCDWGMLERMERVWVSDTNDALDRFDIQRNANLFLPPEVSGVHVGPAACHITGRRLSLDLRAHVALFGHMGLELDLRALSDGETERLSRHIANYKRFRDLLHTGRYWRLPCDDADHTGVCVTSAGKTEALALVLRRGSAELGRGFALQLPGLADEGLYGCEAVGPVSPSVERSLAAGLLDGQLVLSGRVLSGKGLDFFLPRPETSLLMHFKAV